MIPHQEEDKRIVIPEEFQPVIARKEERSPFVVVKQTYLLLNLFSKGALVTNFSWGKDYLDDYTLGYLEAAKQGGNTLFDKEGVSTKITDPNLREASCHTAIVLSYIPELLSLLSRNYEFSQGGMFRPPETKEEYLERVEEMQKEIGKILNGQIKPDDTDKLNFPLIRTYAFFKVGGKLPVKLTDAESRVIKKQRTAINNLLQDIDFSGLD